MSAGKIKIAILGAGAMGSAHAGSYRNIDTVEVTAVFSRDPKRAAAAAAICGARPCTLVDELFADPSIDAVDVCVPSVNHREYVVATLKHGKHVFCETPFALSIEDGRAMIEAAHESKRILMVGLLMRSIAHYEHARRAVVSGEYGRLLSVVAYRLGSYLHPGAPDHKPHYSDPSTELMTFDFDFVQWLMGQPARISASAVATEHGTPGEISTVLGYDDGRSATVLASGLMPKSFPFSVGYRAVFERGALDLQNVFEAGPPKTSFTFYPVDGVPQEVAVEGNDPYEKELRLFAGAIGGSNIGVDLLAPEHAMRALALSIATQRSLRERCTVEL
jgi:UDP-N-acetylglucosamine 3-dehydrogenase